MADSRFANVNRLFHQKYPDGTEVTRSQIEQFGRDVTRGANGYQADLVLASGLAYDDEKKRANRVRSDIVRGGDDFVIDTIDAKAGIYVVKSATEHKLEQASPMLAIDKGSKVVVATKKARKNLDDLDVEDLSDTDQQKLEIRKGSLDQFIATQSANLKSVTADYRATAMRSIGAPDEVVTKLLAMMPEMEALSRIQRRLT